MCYNKPLITVGISIGSFIAGIISGLTCGLLCSIMFKLVQKKQLKYKQTPSVPIYEDIKLQDNPASEVEITPNMAYGQTMKKLIDLHCHDTIINN